MPRFPPEESPWARQALSLAFLVVDALKRRLEFLGFDVDIQAGGGVDERLEVSRRLASLQEVGQTLLMIWHVVVRQTVDGNLPVDLHWRELLVQATEEVRLHRFDRRH